MDNITPEEVRIDNLLDEMIEKSISIVECAEDYCIHIRTKDETDILFEANEIYSDGESICFYGALQPARIDNFTLLILDKSKKATYFEKEGAEGQEVRFTCAEDLEILKNLFMDERGDNVF